MSNAGDFLTDAITKVIATRTDKELVQLTKGFTEHEGRVFVIEIANCGRRKAGTDRTFKIGDVRMAVLKKSIFKTLDILGILNRFKAENSTKRVARRKS